MENLKLMFEEQKPQTFHNTPEGFFLHLHYQAKYHLSQDSLGQQLSTSHCT